LRRRCRGEATGEQECGETELSSTNFLHIDSSESLGIRKKGKTQATRAR
jgi:hypothetical protein